MLKMTVIFLLPRTSQTVPAKFLYGFFIPVSDVKSSIIYNRTCLEEDMNYVDLSMKFRSINRFSYIVFIHLRQLKQSLQNL